MTETQENIFLFVPNIIGMYLMYIFIGYYVFAHLIPIVFIHYENVSGFGRVILAIISFYFMPTHCVLACVCYVTSALLDAIDGHAARYFNQSKCFIWHHIIELLLSGSY